MQACPTNHTYRYFSTRHYSNSLFHFIGLRNFAHLYTEKCSFRNNSTAFTAIKIHFMYLLIRIYTRLIIHTVNHCSDSLFRFVPRHEFNIIAYRSVQILETLLGVVNTFKNNNKPCVPCKHARPSMQKTTCLPCAISIPCFVLSHYVTFVYTKMYSSRNYSPVFPTIETRLNTRR